MLYINQELPRHPEYLLLWNGVAASCSMKSKQPLLVISLCLLVKKWTGQEDLGSGKGLVLCSPHFTLEWKKLRSRYSPRAWLVLGSPWHFMPSISSPRLCSVITIFHACEWARDPFPWSIFLSSICSESPVLTAVNLGLVLVLSLWGHPWI